jgi:hypothetical protein
MKKIYSTILMIGLLLPAGSYACHNSDFSLISMQDLGSNQFEFTVQFCVGHGCDINGVGADGYTGTWAVWVDNNAAINTFPATLTSPATGAEFTGSNVIYGDSILIYDRPLAGWGDTWACIDHTCTPVMQACISFTFTTIGMPNKLVLMGAEGMGVGVAPYGCNGLDKMEIDLNSPSADAGANQEVIYGYGSNCVDIVGSASDGVGPYSYSWSSGDNTAVANVCPTQTTIYTLTVTDFNGNQATADVTVVVNDITCGNDKVYLCHRGDRTKCVRTSRVQRHLDHGDELGMCPSSRLVYEEPDLDHGLFIFPNPASDQAELEFVTDDDGEVSIVIFTVAGKMVQQVTSGMEVKMDDVNYLDLELNGYAPGLYQVVLESSSGERMVKKLHIVR